MESDDSFAVPPMTSTPTSATTKFSSAAPLSPTQSEKGTASTMKKNTFDPRLSAVSQKYDRGNKGYLDDTERKLRDMDSEDLGHLDVEKVYKIMTELQKEQHNSTQLRKIIYALAAFSLLLAVSNIGTSFAAAKLAKDMSVNSATNDLQDIATGQRIGTSSKISVYEANVANTTVRHSKLRHGRDLLDLVGTTISREQGDALYRELCSGWPGITNYKGTAVACGSGTEYVLLHASCGVDTKLKKYSSDPVITPTGMVKFTFDTYRGDVSYTAFSPVIMECNPKAKPSIACTISGPLCQQMCSVCDMKAAPPTYQTYWACPYTGFCGCSPSQCVAGIEPPTCPMECLNSDAATGPAWRRRQLVLAQQQQ